MGVQSSAQAVPQNYVMALDGLRGFAALLVVVGHCSNAGWYLLPYLNATGVAKTGVYLFFILSSYLLASQLFANSNLFMTKQELLRYVDRRVMRIYPLYGVFLIMGLATSELSKHFLEHVKGIPITLDLKEFVQQLFLLRGEGLTWSIVVEFKFYFFLPFFVVAIKWLSKFGTAVLVFSLLVAMAVLGQLFPPEMVNPKTRHMLSPYLVIFLAGISVAFYHRSSRAGSAGGSSLLTYLAYFALLAELVMVPAVFELLFFKVEPAVLQKLYILHAALWSIVVMEIVENQGGLLSRLLSTRVLIYVGKVSFSLYLLHGLGMGVARYLDIPTIYKGWLALCVAITIASISYVLIEKPTMRMSLFSKFGR